MKSLVLIAALSLAACGEPSLEYENINWDNVPIVNFEPTMCERGIILSVKFEGLMQRALDLDSVKGGLLYMEVEKDKTALDIVLKDACGYEAEDKGTLI